MYINKFFKFGTLYLGNDSGPLHLAAALNLPTVAFFVLETRACMDIIKLHKKCFTQTIFVASV